MVNSFLLYESVVQAKKFLEENNFDLNNSNISHKFNIIKDLLKKKPNLIGKFVEWHFGNEQVPYKNNSTDNPDKYYDSLSGLYNYIVLQDENLKTFLPKPIIQYDTFEHLIDDITSIQDDIKINMFMKSIYSFMKLDININDKEVRHVILKFMNLPNDVRNQMTPLKFYKENNKTGKDYLIDLKNFVEGSSNNIETLLLRLDGYKNVIDIVYKTDKVVVVRGFDEDFIKQFGSMKWCIVYAQNAYWSRYCNPLNGNTQYIIFNFNVNPDDDNSLFGVSIKEDGHPHSGGCQNKANKGVTIEEIKTHTNIPDNIIVPYKYPKDIIKNYFTNEEILEKDKGSEYFTKDEIDAMNLSLEKKLEYKLYDSISDDEIKNLSTEIKLNYFQRYDYPKIKNYITKQELFNLDLYYKLKKRNIESKKDHTNVIKLHDYITDEEKEELRKLDTKTKLKYLRQYDYTEILKLITKEELFALDTVYKLENKDEYFVNLHNYITTDEYSKLDVDTKIQYKVNLTDNEIQNLTWSQLYLYNGNEFSEEEWVEVKKAPFREKVKIKGLLDKVLTKTDLDHDNFTITAEEDGLEIGADEDYYDSPLGYILGFDDNDGDFYNFAHSFTYDGTSSDLYGEEDYIAHYLDEKTLSKIETLMNFFNFEFTDINDSGVIKTFFEEYSNFIKYEKYSQYNSRYEVEELDLDDLMTEIRYEVEDKFDTMAKDINNILPYSIEGTDKITLSQDYIIELINKHDDIVDIKTLLENIDQVDDLIKEYNEENPDSELKLKTIDECKYEVVVNAENSDWVKHLDDVIEYLDENKGEIDEERDQSIDFENILKQIGFDTNRTLTKNNINIEILNKDFIGNRVKIRRTNDTTNKQEVGWVKIENLSDYFQKNLFEKKVLTYDGFVNEKITV